MNRGSEQSKTEMRRKRSTERFVPCNLGKKLFNRQTNEQVNEMKKVYKEKNKKTRDENTGRV